MLLRSRLLSALVVFWSLPLRAAPDRPLEIAEDPEQPTQVGYHGGDAPPPSHPHRRGHFPEGLFLPVGLGVAGAAHPNLPTALSFGAEASVVAFPVGHGNWVGAYSDLYLEPKNELTRASLGLEAGFIFIGVDGGLLMQASENGTHWGGVVRPMFTLGFLSVFARWGWLKGDEDFREIGCLVKFPIHLMELDLDEPPPAPPAPRR
ncbi:MAG: hypothetical protein IPM35_39205 [Myxococcales bacterium]|nr:hypothetical protein [Myxococcales bacterium]